MGYFCDLTDAKPSIVKLAVIGGIDAGKSTLIAKLVTGSFIDSSMKSGIDVSSWMISVDDFTSIEASFFEFDEQEEFAFFQAAAVTGANAVVIVTEWNQLRNLDFDRIKKAMKGNHFFDLRNIYSPARMAKAGFDYHSVGRPNV